MHNSTIQSPPKAGTIYAVTASRTTKSGPQRVTKLFRQLPAAQRFADRLRDEGRGDVRIWSTRLAPWRGAG